MSGAGLGVRDAGPVSEIPRLPLTLRHLLLELRQVDLTDRLDPFVPGWPARPVPVVGAVESVALDRDLPLQLIKPGRSLFMASAVRAKVSILRRRSG